jgi:SHS2 domain-containing protein
MPFEELPHTADWALRVRAESLDRLFEESARGLYALSGTRLAKSPRVRRMLELAASDVESLLVSFLSELVFIAEQEHLGFDEVTVKTGTGESKSRTLSAALVGAPILSQDKAVKAVTYHNLQIEQTADGWEAVVVVDV